ncbi:L-erythro-3,5-diaminohexanoate dehydrogenase [Rhodoligotrophos appendicifer]|uniref:zinc-binding dehydrogenase n=1 Tax=Rhodoligotrophos appendicifer TaxID=987056 RepID=UPI001184EE3E|nr:zinc-binding dehydrogenase [Rhodoligotrophos appendicifer]
MARMGWNGKGRGCSFGSHRASGNLPQPAWRLDATPDIWSNEILIAVERLNLDSSSLRQIAEAAGGNKHQIAARIEEIVAERGKMHNPETNSGGVALGRVAAIGPDFPHHDLHVGDAVCTMVSLSLTPLALERGSVAPGPSGQIAASGTAVLFESGLYAKIPADLTPELALTLCDIAGAPATAKRLVQTGNVVAVLGAGGKAGITTLFAARERLGISGRLIAMDADPMACQRVRELGIADLVIDADLRDALTTYRLMMQATNGTLADLVFNTTNVGGTESASILAARQRGTVVLFSMATSFQAAALGAEGLGRDVTLLIGNGYLEGWVEYGFGLARRHPALATYLTASKGPVS